MKRHSLDTLSLVFGLLFTAVAVVGLTDRLTLTVVDVRWIGPALLVAIGIALVVTAGRNRNGAHDPAGEPAVATVDPTSGADDPFDPADNRDESTAGSDTDR